MRAMFMVLVLRIPKPLNCLGLHTVAQSTMWYFLPVPTPSQKNRERGLSMAAWVESCNRYMPIANIGRLDRQELVSSSRPTEARKTLPRFHPVAHLLR
jgi:hypothetical protein